MSINPMQSAHDAPRCKAKSKRTGKPCRAPAVRSYRVCRMHGARGGAPEGKRNGNFMQAGARRKPLCLALHQRAGPSLARDDQGTNAPDKTTSCAVLNMRSVTKVVGRAFPLLYIVGDHARGFHRGLAELGVAGDLTLDALTFGMQEVAQAFELGNQSFDL